MQMQNTALVSDIRRLAFISSRTRDWVILAALLVLALAIRLAFFNGPFGSDDLVYLNRAVQISEGIWTSANYNGALRYGFNIPAGFLMYLFGVNVISANLWPLFCSIVEIVAVYVLASSLWGRRAALYATLILAFMPLHVASSTRIHADPVVACFLTLSFVFFYFAQQHGLRWLYFLAGVAMGFVFWAKELAVVTLLAFIFYPFIWGKFDPRWIYVVSGGIVMLLGHFALMSFIAGDPFHAFKVVMRQVSQSFIQGGDVAEDGVWYYFKYLFVDIKHIGLAGIVASLSILLPVLVRHRSQKISSGTAYVIFWLLALLGILSFMPVSLEPLKFVMKQSNYLTLFLAPLALLAGYYVASLPRRAGLVILATILGAGFFLAGMEQQAYRTFTSNSKAAVDFANNNPGTPIVGSNNNGNIAAVYSTLNQDRILAESIRYMGDMPHNIPAGSVLDKKIPGFAILDKETMGWGKNAVSLGNPPSCWETIGHLVPTGFGLGKSLLEVPQVFISFLPEALQLRLRLQLEKISQPGLAVVYRVNMADFWCERENTLN